MSDIVQKLVNYYINNPPFEISDNLQPAYIESLTCSMDSTLIEYSENFPILSEKTITTANDATSIDIYTDIDTDMMSIILFLPEASISAYLFKYGMYYNSLMQEHAYNSEISILNMVAISDKMHLIDEWASSKKEYIVFEDSKIKALPSSTYYVLYNRYRKSTEIQKQHQTNFKELFDINMLLSVYSSQIFSSEGGIKSVSLSGLSVSFNVPDMQTYQADLVKKKQDILSSMIDFSDCVESY